MAQKLRTPVLSSFLCNVPLETEESHSGQSPGNVKVLPCLPLFKKILEREYWDFPDGPVVKTPCLQCTGPGFYPWSGN